MGLEDFAFYDESELEETITKEEEEQQLQEQEEELAENVIVENGFAFIPEEFDVMPTKAEQKSKGTTKAREPKKVTKLTETKETKEEKIVEKKKIPVSKLEDNQILGNAKQINGNKTAVGVGTVLMQAKNIAKQSLKTTSVHKDKIKKEEPTEFDKAKRDFDKANLKVDVTPSVLERAHELHKEAVEKRGEIYNKDTTTRKDILSFLKQAYNEQFENTKDYEDTPEKVLAECIENVKNFDLQTRKTKAIPEAMNIIKDIDEGKITSYEDISKRLTKYVTILQYTFKGNRTKFNSFISKMVLLDYTLHTYFTIKSKSYFICDKEEDLLSYIKEHREELFKMKPMLDIERPSSFSFRYNNNWFFVDVAPDALSKNVNEDFTNIKVYAKNDMKKDFDYSSYCISDYDILHTFDKEKMKYYNDVKNYRIPKHFYDTDEPISDEEPFYYWDVDKVSIADWLSILGIHIRTVGKLKGITVDEDNVVHIEGTKPTKKEPTEAEYTTAEEEPNKTEELSQAEVPTEQTHSLSTLQERIEELKDKIRKNLGDVDKKLDVKNAKFNYDTILRKIDKGVYKTTEDVNKAQHGLVTMLKPKAKRKKLLGYMSSIGKLVENNVNLYYALSTDIFTFNNEALALEEIRKNAIDWFKVGGIKNIPVQTDWICLYNDTLYFVSTDWLADWTGDNIITNFYRDATKIADMQDAASSIATEYFIRTSDKEELAKFQEQMINNFVYRKTERVMKEFTIPNIEDDNSPIFNENALKYISDIQLMFLTCMYLKYNKAGVSTYSLPIYLDDFSEVTDSVNVAPFRQITLYLPDSKADNEETTSNGTHRGSHTAKCEHDRKGHLVHRKNGTTYYRRGSTVNKGKGDKKPTKYVVKERK